SDRDRAILKSECLQLPVRERADVVASLRLVERQLPQLHQRIDALLLFWVVSNTNGKDGKEALNSIVELLTLCCKDNVDLLLQLITDWLKTDRSGSSAAFLRGLKKLLTKVSAESWPVLLRQLAPNKAVVTHVVTQVQPFLSPQYTVEQL